jgi:uncharacterized protein (TIGR03790 family)
MEVTLDGFSGFASVFVDPTSRSFMTDIMTRAIVVLVYVLAPAFAQEVIFSNLQTIDATTGDVYGWGYNASSPSTVYTVNICFDSPTSNCASVLSNGSTDGNGLACAVNNLGPGCFNYIIPSGTVGSITPKDGATHLVYVSTVSHSNPGAGDVNAFGSPSPIRYDVSRGQWQHRYSAVLSSLPRRLEPFQVAVLVNTNDAYSAGSSGSPVCPSGSTLSKAILDDGVAGYYVRKWGIPCANVYGFSAIVSASMTVATFNSTILPVLKALPSSLQAIAASWVEPSWVSGSAGQAANSITSMLATGIFFIPTNTLYFQGSTLGGDVFTGAQPNPYFNTTSKTPFTDFGIRPAMLLAGQACTICSPGSPDWTPSVSAFKSVIDNAFSATDTNPTGVVKLMQTIDTSGRNARARAFSPLDLGSSLSPYATASIVPSTSGAQNYLNNQSNILYYAQSLPAQQNTAGSYNWGTGDTYSPGGVADSMTSGQGILPSNGSQTPATAFLAAGAVGSYGCVSEPAGILNKFPDPAIFIPNYTHGQTLIEAYYKSVKIPYQCNFIGDPLAAPYSVMKTPPGLPKPSRPKRGHAFGVLGSRAN